MRLDNRDIKILAVLQTEGRITKTELAKRVNLSPTPCWERLKRLEDAGIIEGYGAHISHVLAGPLTTVFMEAEIVSHQAEDFTRFEKAVETMPEAVECWAVGGGIDYMIKFVCRDVAAYQKRVDVMLDSGIGLKRYYSYVVTKPVKKHPSPPMSLLSGE